MWKVWKEEKRGAGERLWNVYVDRLLSSKDVSLKAHRIFIGKQLRKATQSASLREPMQLITVSLTGNPKVGHQQLQWRYSMAHNSHFLEKSNSLEVGKQTDCLANHSEGHGKQSEGQSLLRSLFQGI